MTEQAFTLYLDLDPNKRPRLGAIGKAAIELEKMAGEALFISEPSLQFELVFNTTAPGSLRIITWLKGQVTAERLRDLAIIVATVLTTSAVGHIQGKVMDEIYEAVKQEEPGLSDEDVRRIAEEVGRIVRNETVIAPRRELYHALESDEAVTGVGAVATDEDRKPTVIVPNSEFSSRSQRITMQESTSEETERTVPKRVEIVLVQAPLIDSKRQWRIHVDGAEYGAKMLDDEFRRKLLEGDTELRLATGIILDVTLELKQVLRDGLWHNDARSITEVHGWRQNPEQAELLLAEPGDDDDQTQE